MDLRRLERPGARAGEAAKAAGPPAVRQLLPALVGVFVLMIATVAATAWMARQQDLLAQAASRRTVAGHLEAFDERTRALLLDYAVWTDAHDRVMAGDEAWMTSNIGASAETGTFDVAVVLRPDAPPIAWDEDGPAAMVPLEPAALSQVSALLDRAPVDSGAAEVAYVRSGGALWFLAIGRVVPQDGVPASVSDADLPRLLIGFRMTSARLEAAGRRFMIDGLSVGAAPVAGMDHLPLPGVDGQPAGFVSWQPPTPGRAVLRAALPPLVALMIAVVAIGIVVVRELVRSAQRLGAALDKAQAADRIKTEFLSNVSHELRTPLSGVIGVAQLLQMRRLDPEAREMVDLLLASARSQLTLVNGLLDITRIESGAMQLSAAPFDPGVIVEDSVRLVAPQIAAKRLGLEVAIASEARGLVLGDPVAFGQVVTNLVGNAMKFTEAGRISVRLEGGGSLPLRLVVADTGIGIDPSQHARIFERFVQVDGAATRRVGGAGLGLAITTALVEMQGGSIAVASELGGGATFTVVLPLPVVAAAVAPAA